MDFLKSDDDLGYARLPLKGMQDAHELELELPITGNAALFVAREMDAALICSFNPEPF
jgi:hypothetical protein